MSFASTPSKHNDNNNNNNHANTSNGVVVDDERTAKAFVELFASLLSVEDCSRIENHQASMYAKLFTTTIKTKRKVLYIF